MILQLIAKYPDLVCDYKIKKFRNIGCSSEIILELNLVDKTSLYVKEYLFSDKTRKYSYHWQSEDSKCIIRWDNVPHHQEVDTFPFHKHVNEDENLEDSEVMNLEKVLELIRNKIL